MGRCGPVVLDDAALGAGARVDGGYVAGAVLLAGASVGPSAHVRAGTLLEEQASTAHAVGLKQTILLPFVTLGSLINFCDVLMAGGTSRRDHSEVGSGFIHFNYTPWGSHGDKATPSLVGDVTRGVFLRERRIFLGGSAGLVGPGSVGYGAITGAGQVVRRPVAAGHLHVESMRARDVASVAGRLDPIQPRAGRNVAYLAQLAALRLFYRAVRRPRARQPGLRLLLDAAEDLLTGALAERRRRLESFLAERGGPDLEVLELDPDPGPCPLPLERGPQEHLAWVAQLTAAEVEAGARWLQATVDAVVASAPAPLRP